MRIHTNHFRAGRGWQSPLPVELDGPATLVLAFGGSLRNGLDAAIGDLLGAFGHSSVIGCSTAGEISGERVDDDGLSVAVVRFDHTRIHRAHTALAHADASTQAGTQLAQSLLAAGDDLRAVFVLSEGLTVNGTQLVHALTAGLPAGVAVSGGLAGDGTRFDRTWVMAGGRPAPAQVTAVGLYGQRLQVGTAGRGGWADFGPERRITRSAGNALHELDGQPALDLYRRYLGDLAAQLPGSALRFPLSVWPPGQADRPLVRTVLGIDEASRSIRFAGDMPEGHTARLMRTTTDQLVDSAAAAADLARAALEAAGAHPGAAAGEQDMAETLAISISCVGRRLVMGERTEEELEAVAHQLPPGCAHLGFYAYGEIAPDARGGCSELHNQTMTVTVWRES